MKKILKLISLLAVAVVIFSCDKDEDMAVANVPTDNNTLIADKSSVVLVKENADDTSVIFNWKNPNYGVSLSVTNVLQFAVKGSDFAAPKEINLDAGILTKELSVLELNNIMLNLNLPVNEASDLDVRLKSSVNNAMVVYSQSLSLTVTPYASISYLYAPGAYQNWDPATAETLVSATSNGEYIGYIKFSAPNTEFKITLQKNWDNSYGTDDNVNLIYNGGGNLKAVSEGYQMLKVDTNALTFNLVPYSMGLIGSATPTGWDSDTDMTWNSTTQQWEIANIFLTAGELKFRLNNAWDVNYGGANGVIVVGGDNISLAVPGNYKVTLDLINLKYTLVKI